MKLQHRHHRQTHTRPRNQPEIASRHCSQEKHPAGQFPKHVILDGNIRDAVKNGTPDGKEHPGLFNKKGHIGFLGHGSPVKFRNIRIKELK